MKVSYVKKVLKHINVLKLYNTDATKYQNSSKTFKVISCSLNLVVLPGKTKIATLVPLDKDKPNKNDILNYKPVSE